MQASQPVVQLDRGPFASQLDYKSRLQFNAPTLDYALSGIICTIGPATNKPETIVKLIEAGMRVVRLNFSHGTHEYHCRTIQAARKAIDCYTHKMGVHKPVAIALDTKGPEIRTGQNEGSDTAIIVLKRGDKIKLTTDKSVENKGNKNMIYVDYEKLSLIIKPENIIYIDDGLISMRVLQVIGNQIVCEVVNGGKLGSRKGVNLPGTPVDLPSISERDKLDLKFGVEQDVDMIFTSFIRDATAIDEIRKILGTVGKHIKIISKIENQQGLQNIDSIIAASDGVMVARGDLGIEISTEQVVLAQKCIIAKCNKMGKPVICATQMLASMEDNPRPTRSEASDVGNAIFDGADCVMLSGETAKGMYPVECVRCMTDLCSKVESVLWYEQMQNEMKTVVQSSTSDNLSAITLGITEIASLSRANAIVIVSPCPLMAQLISQFRPRCPIVFVTGNPRVARQSVLYRGVCPLVPEAMANGCIDFARILTMSLEQMAKLKIINVDQTLKVMSVNALKADKISFRLLHMKQKSQETKCKETAAIKAKCSAKITNCFKKS
ncbi:GH13289 [Drosophila grimshawi]|uniref:Pyruvate kinase n=1 Tax=Drosophila grimshawi TaxID=7222 RepID=B4JTZ0_DROGR|nr:GH13289 [Drosophila grimshawi]